MNDSKIDCLNANNTANKLFQDISKLIETTQQQTLRKISQTGVLLYWHIGQRVNHDVLDSERAKYGAGIIDALADKLQIKFGSGFGRRVKWSHFVFLLNIESKLKREFYAEMCRIERYESQKLLK